MTTTMNEAQGKAALYGKIAEVMAALDRIPKRGYNAHFGYNYATEADVNEALRKELAERSVCTFVSSKLIAVRDAKTSGGKDTLLTDVEVSITFACGETGATVTIAGVGTGDDPSDKGTYKAVTGAVKYALLKSFLISTGDDPEQAADHQDASPGATVAQAHAAAGVGTGHRTTSAQAGFMDTPLKFGKHKGKRPLDAVDDEDLRGWLEWWMGTEPREGHEAKTRAQQQEVRDFLRRIESDGVDLSDFTPAGNAEGDGPDEGDGVPF